MKQLVILAGGKGTRLQSRLKGLPKPLATIGNKTILEHQILLAKEYGFNNILILIEFAAEKIIEHLQDGKQFGVTIKYIKEPSPLGTAGSIINAYEHLAPQFIVMYGDTMLNIDLNKFWQYHKKNYAQASLLLHPNDHPQDSDLVETDKTHRICKFHPYPHPDGHFLPNLVNAALYIINKASLTPYLNMNNTPLDFGKQLFPKMLKDNVLIMGYKTREYIKDAGTPSRLDKVCDDYLSGKIQKSSLSTPIPAIFLDRDGIINKANGHINNIKKFELVPQLAETIYQINCSNYLAVVITNQPVIARGECNEAELQQIHNKLESQLGMNHAYLDQIYYCPHHPDSGFHGEIKSLKIKCECRKPNIGLINQAQAELNIDLTNSWFIGDTFVDIKTAKNAQLKSILIRNEYSGDNCYPHAQADFEFSNLHDAVNFILHTSINS